MQIAGPHQKLSNQKMDHRKSAFNSDLRKALRDKPKFTQLPGGYRISAEVQGEDHVSFLSQNEWKCVC